MSSFLKSLFIKPADTNGRRYATVRNTRLGSVVEADAGFTCLPAGARRSVAHDLSDNALCVECDCGKHYLDGQLDRHGIAYIGFYPSDGPADVPSWRRNFNITPEARSARSTKSAATLRAKRAAQKETAK